MWPMSQTTKEMDDDWKDGTLILKIGKSYVTETNETRRRSRKNFITFLCLIYNQHPLSTMNEEWRWRDGDWRNWRGTINTRTNSPRPLIWKDSKILEPQLIYFPYSFWNRHWRFDILKPTNKNNPSKYTFGLFFNTRTLHLEQALIQVWNPWRVRRGSVTIFIPSHTLFLW